MTCCACFVVGRGRKQLRGLSSTLLAGVGACCDGLCACRLPVDLGLPACFPACLPAFLRACLPCVQIVFGSPVWVGRPEDNPEEKPLPLPSELEGTVVHEGGPPDYSYGAGGCRCLLQALVWPGKQGWAWEGRVERPSELERTVVHDGGQPDYSYGAGGCVGSCCRVLFPPVRVTLPVTGLEGDIS